MLQDNLMAADVQDMLKHQTMEFTKAAIESSNPQIRNAFLQLRAAKEQAHWEMYQLSEQKGWYLPAAKADNSEITRVKQYFQGAVNQVPEPVLR